MVLSNDSFPFLRKKICSDLHYFAVTVTFDIIRIVCDITDCQNHDAMLYELIVAFWHGYTARLLLTQNKLQSLASCTPMIYRRFNLAASILIIVPNETCTVLGETLDTQYTISQLTKPIFNVSVSRDGSILARGESFCGGYACIIVIGGTNSRRQGVTCMSDITEFMTANVPQEGDVIALAMSCLPNITTLEHAGKLDGDEPSRLYNDSRWYEAMRDDNTSTLSSFCDLIASSKQHAFINTSNYGTSRNIERGWCFESALSLFNRCVPVQFIPGYSDHNARDECSILECEGMIHPYVCRQYLAPLAAPLPTYKFRSELYDATADTQRNPDGGVDAIVPDYELKTCVIFTCSVSCSYEKYMADLTKIDDRIKRSPREKTMLLFGDHLPHYYHTTDLSHVHVVTVCVNECHLSLLNSFRSDAAIIIRSIERTWRMNENTATVLFSVFSLKQLGPLLGGSREAEITKLCRAARDLDPRSFVVCE